MILVNVVLPVQGVGSAVMSEEGAHNKHGQFQILNTLAPCPYSISVRPSVVRATSSAMHQSQVST
jgi:hypothetical protein